jgi:hypothetical protein
VHSSPAYAQSTVQSVFDDTDTIGFLIFVGVLAITFIAGKLSERRKSPR